MKTKKALLALALAIASFAGAQAQLLYKISGNALDKPSYIIGTHHLANISFVDSIPGVKQALTETGQVYGELDMKGLKHPDSLAILQRAQQLPEGQNLVDLLTPDYQQKLNATLKKLLGSDLSNPFVANQMGRLSPVAMYVNLTVLIYLSGHMGEFDPTSPFDEYFQTQALANNEPVGGLETASFQSQLLFGSTPRERQIELLCCLLDHPELAAQVTEMVTKAFKNQDIDALNAVANHKTGTCLDPTPEENDIMIYKRNADWAARMPAIMKAAPTFFAVGALHLPGEKGLLNLLKQAGYTIEGVK